MTKENMVFFISRAVVHSSLSNESSRSNRQTRRKKKSMPETNAPWNNTDIVAHQVKANRAARSRVAPATGLTPLFFRTSRDDEDGEDDDDKLVELFVVASDGSRQPPSNFCQFIVQAMDSTCAFYRALFETGADAEDDGDGDKWETWCDAEDELLRTVIQDVPYPLSLYFREMPIECVEYIAQASQQQLSGQRMWHSMLLKLPEDHALSILFNARAEEEGQTGILSVLQAFVGGAPRFPAIMQRLCKLYSAGERPVLPEFLHQIHRMGHDDDACELRYDYSSVRCGKQGEITVWAGSFSTEHMTEVHSLTWAVSPFQGKIVSDMEEEEMDEEMNDAEARRNRDLNDRPRPFALSGVTSTMWNDHGGVWPPEATVTVQRSSDRKRWDPSARVQRFCIFEQDNGNLLLGAQYLGEPTLLCDDDRGVYPSDASLLSVDQRVLVVLDGSGKNDLGTVVQKSTTVVHVLMDESSEMKSLRQNTEGPFAGTFPIIVLTSDRSAYEHYESRANGPISDVFGDDSDEEADDAPHGG